MVAKKTAKGIDKNFDPIKQLVLDNKISHKEIADLSNIDYPLFSFKYLRPNSIKDCNNASFFYDFIIHLSELSQQGWDKIRLSHRHKYGMEALPKEIFKPNLSHLSDIVTRDVKKLHVFRANKDLYPFVGLQVGKIFYIFFIEAKFGDIYDHN